MPCSELTMMITGSLHGLAIAFSVFGSYTQIKALKEKKSFSPILAICLTIMLLLRVPNQICVAMENNHGWFSVVGTLVGAAGFAYLTYVSVEEAKKIKQVQQHNNMLLHS